MHRPTCEFSAARQQRFEIIGADASRLSGLDAGTAQGVIWLRGMVRTLFEVIRDYAELSVLHFSSPTGEFTLIKFSTFRGHHIAQGIGGIIAQHLPRWCWF
jgi:hypothetical protein